MHYLCTKNIAVEIKSYIFLRYPCPHVMSGFGMLHFQVRASGRLFAHLCGDQI